MAKAADRIGQRRELDRDGMISGRERGQDVLLNQPLIIEDETTLGPSLGAIAEDVKGRAAQPPHSR